MVEDTCKQIVWIVRPNKACYYIHEGVVVVVVVAQGFRLCGRRRRRRVFRAGALQEQNKYDT